MPWFSIGELVKAHFRSAVKSREIKLVNVSERLKHSKHVVVMVSRNEQERLPFFFEYYRNIGFDAFIVIDNGSTDESVRYMLSRDDVTVYSTNHSYKKARFGNDWVNFVLLKHCVGKWILYADSDEFLVFPHINERSGIKLLTKYLEKIGKASMFTPMVDMYSDLDVQSNIYSQGQDPLEVCSYFDSHGYEKKYEPRAKTFWLKGGVRGRMFFSHNIWDGPALNKTSLVKWKPSYAFLKSAHQLWPFTLNGNFEQSRAGVSGVLLHFKFLATFDHKLNDEKFVGQHTDEYLAYKEGLSGERIDFMHDYSKRYESWVSLEESGLMFGSGWIHNVEVSEADVN